jgi:glycosyltransferase involved in cell wall biosynthesis
MTVLLTYAWLIAAWWAFALVNLVLNRLLIPALGLCRPSTELPRLSVIIPARNEERDIEEAVSSHCGQEYPGLEVIVVDDQSTDGTSDILDNLADRYSNLKVIMGETLPPDWLGKPHAQDQGVAAATGEFLLFCDADVIYAPGTHARAVEEMERRGLDVLLLLPRQKGRGFWEPLVVSFLDAFSGYAAPTFLVNIPSLRSMAFGLGAGNLARREAFEAIGGMEALRREVLEDVLMGKLLKRYRGRLRLVRAYDGVAVRMYRGLRESIEGFTKNCYSAYDRKPVRAALGVMLDLSVHLAPPLFFLLSLIFPGLSGMRLPMALAWAAGMLCNLLTGIIARQPLWLALAYPLRHILWAWILLRSAVRTHRHGITWRGRKYGAGGGLLGD